MNGPEFLMTLTDQMVRVTRTPKKPLTGRLVAVRLEPLMVCLEVGEFQEQVPWTDVDRLSVLSETFKGRLHG